MLLKLNRLVLPILLVVMASLAACSDQSPLATTDEEPQDEKLQVLATTSIVGDLVSNVGGDLIELTTMLPLGADPHTFAPAPQDVAAVANADVVFVNGLHLEEFLEELIENAGGDAAVVALSDNVATLEFGAAGHDADDDEHGDEHKDSHDEAHEDEHEDEAGHDDAHEDEHDDEAGHDEAHEDEHGDEHEDEAGHDDGHAHEGADPHIWMSPVNALVMVHNIEHALSELDPANAAAYEANAEVYAAELETVDSWAMNQIETIPAENHKLVTDHDAFGYYADRYGLDVVGAVIPAFSTNAEPSAQELAELQETIDELGVKAIFVGVTVNPMLAERMAEDAGIQMISLYTGSLGEVGSGAETYLDFVRYNTTAIIEALQ